MPLVTGAIVPHAPLLLPELESEEVADAAGRIREALTTLDPRDAEVLVIASPHGSAPGIYRGVSGGLRSFGLPEIAVVAVAYEPWDEVPGSKEAAIAGPVDHGIVVPLRLFDWDLPVVALTSNGDPASGVIDTVRVVEGIAATKNVAFVASINTSACLSTRAPYPNDADPDSDERLLEIIRTDLGMLTAEAPAITERSHSCGLTPLLLLAELFAGQDMEVLAHEAPVGVGYLVAQTV